MSGLPEGWCVTRLADISDIALGKMLDRAKRTKGELLPYLRNANVRWGRFDLSDLSEMYFEEDEFDRYEVAPGDLLICEGGEPGRAAVWAEASQPIKYQKALLRVRLLGDIDPHWVMYSLKRDAMSGNLVSYFTGSTIKHFPQQAAHNYSFLLPPLNEQSRIVAKLEKLLSRVDAAQARLATIPRILKRFRQSVLAAACSGKLTTDWRLYNPDVESAETLYKKIQALRNGVKGAHKRQDSSLELQDFEDDSSDVPDTWKWVDLNSLCDSSRGISYGVIKLGVDIEGGVPCLRTSDVRPLRIDVENVKRISPKISGNYARTVLKGNEVLVNVRGTLGGVAAVPLAMQGWNVSREVAVVPLLPLVESKYITFWIASTRSQNWLSGVAKGVAYTGINLEDLRLLPTALPPPAEQQEIVRRVEALFKTADALEARYRTAKAHVDKLTQAILARAFRGELVTTEAELARREGRDYEPASVLLERIRQEREQRVSAPQPKSKRTGKTGKKQDRSTKAMSG
jgi:type I restriction enzyme S subunit